MLKKPTCQGTLDGYEKTQEWSLANSYQNVGTLRQIATRKRIQLTTKMSSEVKSFPVSLDANAAWPTPRLQLGKTLG